MKRAIITRKCWCRGDKDCYSCKGTGIQTSKESLYLCIGGPFDGKLLNWSAVKGEGYSQYNAGGHNRRGTIPKTAIYIHVSVFDKVKV